MDSHIRKEYFPSRDQDGGKSHGGQELEIALRMKLSAQILQHHPVMIFSFEGHGFCSKIPTYSQDLLSSQHYHVMAVRVRPHIFVLNDIFFA